MSFEHLPQPKMEFLCDLYVDIGAPFFAGETPVGNRRIIQVSGGAFHGPEFKGRVIPGGDDWITERNDGTVIQDVRIVLETDDEQLVLMTYKGIRHGPKEVIERLNNNEPVDQSEYYFRSSPVFETSSEKYDWLNKTVIISTGKRVPGKAVYTLYKVL
ncbi:DUF3237 domain-containing protein [Bacillus shivajii]|uniref:DUF3237 domain-containing protein n=1 Tax=Bacillus shivajii TaxID=1983719 RepID=UPI001CF9C60D|nr:DUF3237 domain-containing protein [Bacillus shivajii]UCZ52747.1 DUF3237 domain-containing protein [Bacillus shivajii]